MRTVLMLLYVYLGWHVIFKQPLVISLQNSFFKIISRGRPPSEDVRKHFEKVTEVNGRGRKTPRQNRNYCGNDIIDLIGRLKDHLMKCK
ncbi:hypothetical protein GLOIN_2v1841334 [Rhizophagus irregularis DAOM 181602=DAOM 197198]|uniref:Uncharacterized protein n=1 Tax=Rhizophagus irregularis (strain DAOM 197198w) TaxID=1432141 RepID=A0A015JKJ1_RHIIW|nr:hypothetical protein RirG_091050 [Rhizophagus irregularis DAOM 197198w]GBC19874.1 hypothetical protein GLOIN_2v1841334 [Rhizophagus irregularis DAOM 181602=DAOM 197198]